MHLYCKRKANSTFLVYPRLVFYSSHTIFILVWLFGGKQSLQACFSKKLKLSKFILVLDTVDMKFWTCLPAGKDLYFWGLLVSSSTCPTTERVYYMDVSYFYILFHFRKLYLSFTLSTSREQWFSYPCMKALLKCNKPLDFSVAQAKTELEG